MDPSKLRPFARLARRLPGSASANHLHPATLYRWHARGILKDGQYVRLRAVKVGGRWCSSWAWLNEFFRQTGSLPDLPDVETPKEYRQRQADVDAELIRRGV